VSPLHAGQPCHADTPNSHNRDRSRRPPDYVTKANSGRLGAGRRPGNRLREKHERAVAAIVNSTASPQEIRARLKTVIDSTVDVDDVGRFCLGRFWRLATPDQQKQYMALFHDLMVMKIADHLGEYRGVQIATGLARKSADTQIVITTNTPTLYMTD
jgi:hypothetical protein